MNEIFHFKIWIFQDAYIFFHRNRLGYNSNNFPSPCPTACGVSFIFTKLKLKKFKYIIHIYKCAQTINFFYFLILQYTGGIKNKNWKKN